MKMILEINKKINQHSSNSKEIKKLYLGNEKLNYNKTIELRKKQDNEYKKMMFFKNLKREMLK